MPGHSRLTPLVGLSAVALALGTGGAAFAATPAHAPSAHTHLHPRGNVLLPSGAHHLSSVSAAHPGHRKIILHDSSDNWAGYAASGGTYTSVSASWVQPAVDCSAGDGYSSFWVGLDGDGTSSVEQTGTEADCSGGQASYSSWYEMYPAYPVTYGDYIAPGDSMTASVTTDGSGNFELVLTDATQGWTETQNQYSSTAQDGSAEVIAEAPYSNGVLPLADFGTVDFTSATVNGAPLGDSSPTSINMVSDSGTPEAATSGLGSGGEEFSVTWQSL
jgi:hypothetical protein